MFVRGQSGPPVGWKVEAEWPSFRETEWSVIENQDGDDFVSRPRAGRAQDGEMQSNALCNGIVDPWTGECVEEIRDPWGVKTDHGVVTIEI